MAAFSLTPHLRFDWFLRDVFVLGAIYVPLERFFPRSPSRLLRQGLLTDLSYFFVNHVLAEVLLFLTILPANTLLAWARYEPIARIVAAQPLALQLTEMIVLADVFQYTVHRLVHRVPFLWRFHAVHHSAERLDWIAGSRLHLVDIFVVRSVTFIPLFLGGFSDAALRAYAVFVAIVAVFAHSNVRFRFGWLEKIVVTPAYHAVHHATDPRAIDKNFAIHLPVLDRIFGTQYRPREVPTRFGVAGRPVPDGYFRQLVHPIAGRAADP